MARAKPVMKISGLSSVVAKLALLQAEMPRRADGALKAGANMTVKLARSFAPVDKGDLEDAIVVLKQTKRILGKAEVTVGVDESRMVNDDPTKSVGEYAWLMHEGTYNLGPKSEDKEMELGVEVGPKFLTRALQEVRPGLMSKLKSMLKPSNIIGRRKGK